MEGFLATAMIWIGFRLDRSYALHRKTSTRFAIHRWFETILVKR